MINFFRKVRQQLLTENKFRRYLLYAIGEIALVVIGILIALQINNWNEAKKDDTALKEYLVKIKSNTLEDLREIELSTELRTQIAKTCKEARRSILDKTEQRHRTN